MFALHVIRLKFTRLALPSLAIIQVAEFFQRSQHVITRRAIHVGHLVPNSVHLVTNRNVCRGVIQEHHIGAFGNGIGHQDGRRRITGAGQHRLQIGLLDLFGGTGSLEGNRWKNLVGRTRWLGHLNGHRVPLLRRPGSGIHFDGLSLNTRLISAIEVSPPRTIR